MKRSKQWLCALAVALGCALRGQAFCEEAKFDEPLDFTSSIVRLAATSNWNADPETNTSDATQEPLATPEPTTNDSEPAKNDSADKHCSTCDKDPCCCAPEYSLTASAEATFFWPQFSRDFLTTSVDSGSGPSNFATDSAVATTDGSLLAAPRLTLGIQGCKWGLVGRYWYASQWASGYTPSNPDDAPAGVIAFDGFRAYTIDLEGQRRFYAGDWTAYGFFGVRYALTDNNRTLTATSLSFDQTAFATSFASQQFSGTGITFGVWGIRPICCDSPLKYFVANRYSVLWGNVHAAAETSATATDGVSGFATSTNGALAAGQGDLFIAELQLGLQWDAQLKCFPGRAFLRTAIEYQYWDSNAGIGAFANSFASVAGGANATADASAEDILFNLIGLTIGAGITY